MTDVPPAAVRPTAGGLAAAQAAAGHAGRGGLVGGANPKLHAQVQLTLPGVMDSGAAGRCTDRIDIE